MRAAPLAECLQSSSMLHRSRELCVLIALPCGLDPASLARATLLLGASKNLLSGFIVQRSVPCRHDASSTGADGCNCLPAQRSHSARAPAAAAAAAVCSAAAVSSTATATALPAAAAAADVQCAPALCSLRPGTACASTVQVQWFWVHSSSKLLSRASNGILLCRCAVAAAGQRQF